MGDSPRGAPPEELSLSVRLARGVVDAVAARVDSYWTAQRRAIWGRPQKSQ